MINRERVTSGAIMLLYLLISLVSGGWKAALLVIFPLLVPWALIWHAEALGNYTGWIGARSTVNRKSPASMLKTIGWLFLLTPLVFLTIGWFRGVV